MSRRLQLIILLVIVGSCGSSSDAVGNSPTPPSQPTSTSSTSVPEELGVSLDLAESFITREVTEIPFRVINNEPSEIGWGVQMDIAQFVDGQWEELFYVSASIGEIPPDPTPKNIQHVGTHAEPNQSGQDQVMAFPPLEPGRYRVSLEVSQQDGEDLTEDPQRTIFDEFEVVP